MLGLALKCACEAFGWSQKELAAANRISPSTVSEYASGVLELTLERFEELVTRMGGGAGDLQNAIAAAALIHRSPPPPATPVDPAPEERRVIDRATGRVMHRLGAAFKEMLVAEVRAAHIKTDREEAEALWRRLAPHPAAERRRLMEKEPAFHTWALAVRLCAESEAMAPGCAVEALELAELARSVARRAVVPEPWRPCLEGYTVAFVANAQEGKVAACLMCSDEAIPALEEVRRWFAAKDIPYDTALATLELATLYLEEGHAAKVKELAREMSPIFEEQRIHREALAALILFRDAALQETATAALARRLVRYLTEARHDPERRFEDDRP